MHKSASCFLHVEKSGGSTLIRYLRAALGAGSVYHANESRYQQAPPSFLLNRYPVVAGHFTFERISADLLASTFLFTFLREPLDRVLSLYYYWNRREGPHLPEAVMMAKSRDLDGVLDGLPRPERVSVWSNWQTFLFSGAADCEQPGEELLPDALRNLERCDFVGLYERLDAGVTRLCALRGWPAPTGALPRVNVTAGRPAPEQTPRETVERLRALNLCDVQLYARASELWENAVSESAVAAGSINGYEARRAADASNARSEHGSREILLTSVRVFGERAGGNGTARNLVEQDERVRIELRGRSTIDAADVTAGIRITDAFGAEVYGVNTFLLGRRLAARAGREFRVDYTFEMILAPGVYYVTAAIHDRDDHRHKCYHWIDNAASFECCRTQPPTFSGVADLKADVTLYE